MKSQICEIHVNIPSVDEFASTYRNFGPLARNEGQFVFDLIMSPGSFIRATVATVDLNLPAVAGIAEICYSAVQERNLNLWNDNLKRFIGAAVCCLMEANGFQKTGTKKAIPHKTFTKGEVYELAADVSPIDSNWPCTH